MPYIAKNIFAFIGLKETKEEKNPAKTKQTNKQTNKRWFTCEIPYSETK
jgi:hypothetical protein